MDNLIYLDNSATTKACDKSVEYINRALRDCFGNPSSLYRLGMEAEQELTETREAVAGWLSCRPDEIFFTSGGSESNNTALFGAAYSRKKRGNRIVTTSVEHPSVLRVADRLESEGFEVIRLRPDKNGSVSIRDIENAVNSDTILVSIMLVNNETGAVQPVRAAANAIKKSGAPALLHCDAVQAFGKMKINVKELGIDLLSASGHKIHGPKGIGFLYKSKTIHIPPFILGGGQEQGLRSGTESVPLIAGLRGAVEELPPVSVQNEKMCRLRDYTAEILKNTGFVTVNSCSDGLPYILNISVPGYRSETLLHFLESENIFVSSGSACSKGKGSYVLTECGFDSDITDSALRISFSRFNTESDADALCDALTKAHSLLRRSK